MIPSDSYVSYVYVGCLHGGKYSYEDSKWFLFYPPNSSRYNPNPYGDNRIIASSLIEFLDKYGVR